MQKVTVTIIGAGLTGLSAAVRLHQAGLSVRLIERSNRIGGQIQTGHKDGFTYETGPCTGTLSTPQTVELFDILGDDLRPEIANAAAERRLIYRKGKLVPLPSGLSSAVQTPLFSWPDKFRVLWEPWRKKGEDKNESLADLVRRRLGKTFLSHAVDPFIGGIYAGDPEKLVTRFALPKLYHLEQDYGSFVRGAIKKGKEKKSSREKKATKKIFSTSGGLATLIHRMADYLGEDNIILPADITKIETDKDGYIVSYKDNGDGTETQIRTHYLITTTDANELPKLLPFVPSEMMKPITNLVYAPIVEAAVGYRKSPISLPPNFGALVPSSEGRRVLGVLMLSDCYPDRAPKGGLLTAVFIGGTRQPQYTQLSDEETRALVIEEMQAVLGIPTSIEPDLFHISRHKRAIPQYYADSVERLSAINKIEKRYEGLYLAGGIRDGIGIPNRIAQGLDIADDIILLQGRE